jgi:hypothetical protein
VAIELSCVFATSPESHEHARIGESLGYRRAFFFDSPEVGDGVAGPMPIGGFAWSIALAFGTVLKDGEERPRRASQHAEWPTRVGPWSPTED